MDFLPRSRGICTCSNRGFPSSHMHTQAKSFIPDVSQPSLGGMEHDDRGDMCSSPPSPMYISEGTSHGTNGGSRSKQGIFSQKTGQPHFRKYQDSSLEADDTESELVAIPESDLSDSTIHGSSAPVKYLN